MLVRQEGNRQVRRNIDHYNLDMVIALGYRVQSQVATRFRRWATQRLHEYIQKRFAMDDERLKKGVIVTSVSCCNVSGIFVVVNVTSVNKLRTYMLFQPAIPSDTLQRAVHVVADRWHGKDEVGLELDSSKYPVFITRTRLVARYMFGNNTTGYGVGLAMSF